MRASSCWPANLQSRGWFQLQHRYITSARLMVTSEPARRCIVHTKGGAVGVVRTMDSTGSTAAKGIIARWEQIDGELTYQPPCELDRIVEQRIEASRHQVQRGQCPELLVRAHERREQRVGQEGGLLAVSVHVRGVVPQIRVEHLTPESGRENGVAAPNRPMSSAVMGEENDLLVPIWA